MSIGYVGMVGVPQPKDPERNPQLQGEISHFAEVLGGGNRGWLTFTIAEKQTSWALSIQLSEEESGTQHFRNSRWEPEANEAMVKESEDKPCSWKARWAISLRPHQRT
ncbi:hypothetical protein EDD21DRAFT_410907 [Dissophora ornata]|nr:hypothetical protein EDD21DRAFT_410907 [Dissophora ornata]